MSAWVPLHHSGLEITEIKVLKKKYFKIFCDYCSPAVHIQLDRMSMPVTNDALECDNVWASNY